jgi:hypothetical protein
MTEQAKPAVGKLSVAILLLVLLGTPLTAYLWHTLNNLLQGQAHARELLIALPVAVLFFFLLRYIWRVIERWQSEKHQAQMQGRD